MKMISKTRSQWELLDFTVSLMVETYTKIVNARIVEKADAWVQVGDIEYGYTPSGLI